MNFYSVKVGMATKPSQQELIDLLRNDGVDVIQTSDGVCLKTTKSLNDLTSNEKLAGVTFQSVDASRAMRDSATPADIKAFISSGEK